jgi:hypothetical protein
MHCCLILLFNLFSLQFKWRNYVNQSLAEKLTVDYQVKKLSHFCRTHRLSRGTWIQSIFKLHFIYDSVSLTSRFPATKIFYGYSSLPCVLHTCPVLYFVRIVYHIVMVNTFQRATIEDVSVDECYSSLLGNSKCVNEFAGYESRDLCFLCYPCGSYIKKTCCSLN